MSNRHGTLRIKGTGQTAQYRVEASGSLSEKNNSLEDAQETISDDGTVATGEVSTADDVFNLVGDVVDVQIDGDARAVIDPARPALDTVVREIASEVVGEARRDGPSTAGVLAAAGIRAAGPAGAFDTVQAAWDAAGNGDVVYVHSTYDAEAAGESFPIECDYRDTEATLTGGHPAGSVIDAGDADAPVIEAKGTGATDYQNSPVVQNLTLRGGTVGLKVFGAPFGAFRNLICHDTGSHGVELCERELEGTEYGTFGSYLENCQAWGCGANGFHLNGSAHPHGTYFQGCKATACRGIGYKLAGTCCKIDGGSAQLNFGFGVRADGTKALDIESLYIEGNSRRVDADAPTECYLRGASGTAIRDCYFHGINPRGANHDFERVQRGISAHDSPGLAVADCVVRRYGQGFLSLFGCLDADVHAASHRFSETELWALDPDRSQRIRDNGEIIPCDLTQVDGAREGDRGVHVRDDGSAVACRWVDGRWQPHGETGSI